MEAGLSSRNIRRLYYAVPVAATPTNEYLGCNSRTLFEIALQSEWRCSLCRVNLVRNAAAN